MFVRDGRTLPFVPVTVAAMEAIREHVTKGRPYAVATYLALLEFANEDRSDRVALSQREIVERVGASRSTVQAALAALQGAGVLRITERIHGNARVENEYVVIEPATDGERAESCTPARETGDPPPVRQAANPRSTAIEDPSIAHDGEDQNRIEHHSLDAAAAEPAREGGRACEALRFRGKPVPAKVAAAATLALAEWSGRTGQALKPVKASGKPTDGLSRIIGAMLDYPEVVELWPKMIDVALRAPWWQDGAPGTGVVFGPNVVERYVQQAQRPALVSVPIAAKRPQSTAQQFLALRGSVG